MSNPEKERVKSAIDNTGWKKWGPYLTERQWGTVREDYSKDGSAWDFLPHDHARSKAYRWGEEGIAGICDNKQLLCFGLSMWNGKDPILKERMFGLTGAESNHGEDCKDNYYYLESTPTHSYMKMLYKYPQREFPYGQLVSESRKRTRQEPEYELIDTGVFDDNRYFDVFIEYAKKSEEDVLIKITAANRGPETAFVNLLPTIWFRNTWKWGYNSYKPALAANGDRTINIQHEKLGHYFLYTEENSGLLFCDNETNDKRLYNIENADAYCKDGINEFIVHENQIAINPNRTGTKASVSYKCHVPAGESVTIKLRL
ncbi:MAG TPA: hypothetical protein VNW06_05870, partial [Cytophagaceae bacterium]|nr:hypothetical protein [Cytophagaceae bacterium]